MSVDRTFTHFVLTRFNALAGYATHPQRRLDPEWLEARFRLFERFCYPSLCAQSVPFEWLVFFDAATPGNFLARIDGYKLVTPVFIDEPLSDDLIARVVAERVSPEATHLITTRIDNDDGFADSYLARVQRCFQGQEKEFVNFPLGYDWKDGRLYYRVARSNTFISLIERIPSDRAQVRTVHCGPHTDLKSIAAVRQVISPPVWEVTVHGGNVVNEVRGIRRLRSGTPREFTAIEAELRVDDTFREISLDVMHSVASALMLPLRQVLRRRRSSSR